MRTKQKLTDALDFCALHKSQTIFLHLIPFELEDVEDDLARATFLSLNFVKTRSGLRPSLATTEDASSDHTIYHVRRPTEKLVGTYFS